MIVQYSIYGPKHTRAVFEIMSAHAHRPSLVWRRRGRRGPWQTLPQSHKGEVQQIIYISMRREHIYELSVFRYRTSKALRVWQDDKKVCEPVDPAKYKIRSSSWNSVITQEMVVTRIYTEGVSEPRELTKKLDLYNRRPFLSPWMMGGHNLGSR